MPQAHVTMDVRKASDEVSVVDVRGEFTAFAEGVLMAAYDQASAGGGARDHPELRGPGVHEQ